MIQQPNDLIQHARSSGSACPNRAGTDPSLRELPRMTEPMEIIRAILADGSGQEADFYLRKVKTRQKADLAQAAQVTLNAEVVLLRMAMKTFYQSVREDEDDDQLQCLVQAGMLSDAAALQLARRELAESAFPAVRCEPRGTRESIEKAAEEALGDAALLYLECRGWFETLAWKYAQVSESVVANAAPVTGVQNLGNESSNNRVAQSFSFAAASKLAMIEVRLRRQGNPSDSLMLEIQADLGGQPEGSPIFTASLSSASLPESHYAYVSIPVSPLLNLSAGRTYWLVAKRSGATHASNYYCLAVDEGLAYSGGQCLLYTTVPGRWQPRGVPADLIFRLHAQRLNFTQMAEIFSASNQFMRACTFEGSNSPATPLYKAQLVNGCDAFLELLRLGTNDLGGLSCQVLPDLGLYVSALPPKSKPAFQLSEDGRLRDAFGVSLAPGVHPAGAWLRFGNGPALFVREAIMDALSGEMRIIT